MTPPPNRTPGELFQSAARWYVQGHQGCVCCRGQHCVFRSDWGQRVEYYCSACDFSTCHDLRTGKYYAAVGDGHALPGVFLGAEAV
jgi:hypothetical protein